MKKQMIIWGMMMLAVMTLSMVVACGGDSNGNDNSKPEDPTKKELSPIGVWENGKYFLSFNEENFCSAYFVDDYVDCGNYSIVNNTIICNNTYYAKQTKYIITNLTNVSMEVKIEYTSLSGNVLTKTMDFVKNNNKVPAIKDHSLVGKSYTSVVYLGEVNNSTWSFETYNTGTHSMKSGAASKYPLRVYYIFFDNKIYFQTFRTTQQMPSIGGWSASTTVTTDKISFYPDGSISGMERVK